MVNFPKIMFQP